MQKFHQELRKHYHYHRQFIPHYFVGLFYSSAVLFGLYTLFPPQVQAATPDHHGLDTEVRVVVWGWTKSESLQVSSNYDTPLSAYLERGKLPFSKALVIKPKDLLYPETDYEFKIETKNWLGLQNSKTVSIRTNTLPKVALANKFSDKTQIAADTKFEFKLTSELSTDKFNFNSTPTIEHTKTVEDSTLIVKPKSKLIQGQDYFVSFSLNSETLGDRLLFADNFSVIDPLLIVSSNPSANSDTVPKQIQPEFVFNKEVNTSSVDKLVSVEPTLDYTLNWKDSKTLAIIPKQNLKTATTYSVTFKDSLRGLDSSQLPETQKISFTTAGKVTVVGFGPTGSSANPGSNVTVTFNQPVDQASAQANFSLTPPVAGSFSWLGNSLVFKTAGLGMLTNYTISLAPGIKSLGGEDSVQGFTSNFTTTSERVRTIGYSVRKRAITAYYFGVGSKKILLIGTMHGNEGNTGNMLNSWIGYLRANQTQIQSDRTFIIVPFANPDGRAIGNRFNANNVDLNRNFDLPDWQALTYWQNRSYPNGGGSAPFSEPESRALRDLVHSEGPTLSVTYHSNANLVIGDGIAQTFGDWYAAQTGYTRSNSSDEESDVSAVGYTITGTYEEWVTKRGVKTLVIEFISQTANEYSRNLPALKGLLNYPI